MNDSATRRILLADADAFYVSVARAIDPEGVGRERFLIVGGTRESRGVVCSASYDARAMGVRSAMSIAQALRLCPQAVCVPIPGRACSEKSHAIRRVLERIAPVVEAASIDEWYLDLSGTEQLYRGESLAGTAQRIRTAVKTDTQLTVSIGGGTTKLIAKLAVERAKPRVNSSGVHIVAPGEEGAFLETLALADIPMVGPRFQQRLARLGLVTVPDVLQHDLGTLTAWLGERSANWLWNRVRGIDEGEVHTRGVNKSISRDETFSRDINDDKILARELLSLIGRATTDLRQSGLAARTITVRIRDHDFTTRQASKTVASGVISDRAVLAVARPLLAKLRTARRVPARLLGVGLSSLEAGGVRQLALFDGAAEPEVETERDRTIARTLDRVRGKFGRKALGQAPMIEE